ncbi:endoplasmic reticulum protein [Cerioporus squamosus]|nr:endoplasmic reticulum protein [Cerioporus squamosus]
MTVYYTLTFMLLAAEMATFCVLVFPLPHTVRKKFFNFLSESPIVAKLAYGVKIASCPFITILFVDAVQRMWRVTAEADLAKSSGTGAQDRTTDTYLTGLLPVPLSGPHRTFYIILELIHTQEEYAKLKNATGKSAGADQAKQIEELKQKLAIAEAKTKDYDIVKKQAEQNAKEYDRLATEYNKKTGSVSDKRKD